jgi:putative molybdopterin biosynthesis protein
MHLTDDAGREANAEHLRKTARVGVTLVTLAHWEVGLVIGRGNPKKIRRASDVAHRRVRLVNRERGASPRRVLERRMKAEGATSPAEATTVTSHRELGRTIAVGAADAGPSVRDVAITYGLNFLPLQEERFDLAIPTEMLSTPEMRRLLDLLLSARARTELSTLGYDVQHTGNCVAVA